MKRHIRNGCHKLGVDSTEETVPVRSLEVNEFQNLAFRIVIDDEDSNVLNILQCDHRTKMPSIFLMVAHKELIVETVTKKIPLPFLIPLSFMMSDLFRFVSEKPAALGFLSDP
ncbi:hypothetical protein NPIL_267811 [Nephila pilipes]|uniref:Uncharacterized protein n=1 Tax=Nephila pilipes TaxID=299642 RepID=A0A8X6MQ14_NEPPI|nr:hypothetical protein NPIL_267811 [Nephila pilipes]